MELRLVQEMQSEVDVQLCRLLEKYMFDREITDIDNQVKKAQKLSQEELTYLATSESSSPTHQQNQSHPPVSYATFPLLKDNSNLDQVLEELAYICSQR